MNGSLRFCSFAAGQAQGAFRAISNNADKCIQISQHLAVSSFIFSNLPQWRPAHHLQNNLGYL